MSDCSHHWTVTQRVKRAERRRRQDELFHAARLDAVEARVTRLIEAHIARLRDTLDSAPGIAEKAVDR
jgi:hypothetical protein